MDQETIRSLVPLFGAAVGATIAGTVAYVVAKFNVDSQRRLSAEAARRERRHSMATATIEEAGRCIDFIFELLTALYAATDDDFFAKFPRRYSPKLVKYRARLLGDPRVVDAAGDFEQAYDKFLGILGPVGSAFSAQQPFQRICSIQRSALKLALLAY